MKLLKRESLFIPIKDITTKEKERIKEKLTYHFFKKEKICEECEWLPERVNDVCERCANYTGSYELAKQITIGEKKYLKMPVGSGFRVLRDLGLTDYDYIDKSPHPKIKPFKFLGELKAGQRECIDAMLKKKRGVLKAPPRSGKTVMGSVLASELQMKTLILASQRDWLMGFQETFIGSDTQKALTSLKPSRVKMCKTLEDFENTDICLATVQTFYSEKGQKLLRKLRDAFGLVLIDEVHTSAADKYVGIVAKINAEYMIGLSGTPDRKDGKYVLVDNVIGGHVHEMKTERLRPVVKLTRTGYKKFYKGQVQWPRIVSAMENDKKRQKVIIKTALKDVADGHMILIPCAQVKPVKTLVRLINEAAGKKIAYEFSGTLKKSQRDEYIQRARKYKIKVLVGTQKVLSVGINIPRASMLYETVLSSNMPNAQQRMARVLTPHEGKPTPGIRYFLDDFSIRRNCMRAEYFQVLKPVFNPIFQGNDLELLMEYFKESSKMQQKFDL